MSEILLTAESGCDMTPQMAAEYGVTIVPMHVSFGGQTRDDGAFPVSEMFEHYKKTRDLPRTSGCTPHDFEIVFDRLQKEHPGAQILHLAYSASTTCSLQSAQIAAKGREGIVLIDTKSVAAAQMAIVLRTAKLIREQPDIAMEDVVRAVNEMIERVRMGFFPGDLEYLRAGGRVSNAAYLGATILGLHPLIEIQDGKLLSTKKYRGAMARVITKLMSEYTRDFDRRELYLIYGEGLDRGIMRNTEELARTQGFERIEWVKTGCVIAAHSGPGAFGIVGFAKA